MSESKSSLLAVGLPESGKTTFLAALSYVVEFMGVKGALKLTRLVAERSYINSIQKNWLGCIKTPRSPTGQRIPVELILYAEGLVSEEIRLKFLDVSGEIFNEQLNTHTWSTEYSADAKEAKGLVLFIHPDKIVVTNRIEDRNQAVDKLSDGDDQEGADDVEEIPWDESMLPTSVRLVELLQFHEMGAPNLKKIAVIISAWDRVASTSTDPRPTKWLEENLPQLAQYLASNTDRFTSNVYGVSAQGGDVETEATKLRKKAPVSRIRILDEGKETNDITKPIRWLIKS